MLKRKLLWLATAALALPLAAPAVANSAELKIEFDGVDSYTDVQPASENRARHRDRVLQGFEEIFTELANRLPDDQVLNVKVTDIDLAGYVTPVPRDGGLHMMRIVRHGHEPAIRFEYSLVDANDQVLQEGEERLRGRTGTDSIRRNTSTSVDGLRYEREMIERWFRDTFDAS